MDNEQDDDTGEDDMEAPGLNSDEPGPNAQPRQLDKNTQTLKLLGAGRPYKQSYGATKDDCSK